MLPTRAYDTNKQSSHSLSTLGRGEIRDEYSTDSVHSDT